RQVEGEGGGGDLTLLRLAVRGEGRREVHLGRVRGLGDPFARGVLEVLAAWIDGYRGGARLRRGVYVVDGQAVGGGNVEGDDVEFGAGQAPFVEEQVLLSVRLRRQLHVVGSAVEFVGHDDGALVSVDGGGFDLRLVDLRR